MGGTRGERERRGRFWRARHPLTHVSRRASHKPTEVGGEAKQANRNETIAGTGSNEIITPPRSGEGCGDTLKFNSHCLQTRLVPERKFEQCRIDTPFHQLDWFRRWQTTVSCSNHGLFCSRGQTSSDFTSVEHSTTFWYTAIYSRPRFYYFTSVPTTSQQRKKNPAAVALSKLGASKGGKARAKKLSAKERSRIARLAVEARWRKYRREK